MRTIDFTLRLAALGAGLLAASAVSAAQDAAPDGRSAIGPATTARPQVREPAAPPGPPTELVNGDPLPVLVQQVGAEPPAPPGPPLREMTVTPEALAAILATTGPEPYTVYVFAPSGRSPAR